MHIMNQIDITIKVRIQIKPYNCQHLSRYVFFNFFPASEYVWLGGGHEYSNDMYDERIDDESENDVHQNHICKYLTLILIIQYIYRTFQSPIWVIIYTQQSNM